MFSTLRHASRSGSAALRAAHRAAPVARASRPTAFVRTLISECRAPRDACLSLRPRGR